MDSKKEKQVTKRIWIALICFFILGFLWIGLEVYNYRHTMKEVEFFKVEKPDKMVIGAWDEITNEYPSKRIIFKDDSYQIYLKDGETVDKNTVLENGHFQILEDKTIEINDKKYELTIEAPEDQRFTLIKIKNEGDIFFIGTKISE